MPDGHTATKNRISRRRQWARALGCLLILGMIGVAGLWFVGRSLLAPAPCSISQVDLGVECEELRLPAESGRIVHGWFATPQVPKSIVLLLHPLRGSRLSMVDRARFLLHAGHAVVMVDLQGHGETEGVAITMGHEEKHDVATAIRFVKESHSNLPLVVLGWSLGGASFLLCDEHDVDGVILEAVYPTIQEAVRNRVAIKLGRPAAAVVSPILLTQLAWRLGISAQDLKPIDGISGLSCPVLLVGGASDRRTTLDELERMHTQAGPESQLWVVPKATHEDLYVAAPKAYQQKILQMIGRCIVEWKQTEESGRFGDP